MGITVDTSSSMQLLDRENERRLKRSIADSKYGSGSSNGANNYEAEMLKIGNQAYQTQIQVEQLKEQWYAQQKAEYDKYSVEMQQLIQQLDDRSLTQKQREEIISDINIKKNKMALECPGVWSQIPDEYKEYLQNSTPVDNFNRSPLSVVASATRDTTRMSGGRFTFKEYDEDTLQEAQFNNQNAARVALANQPKRKNYASGRGSLNGKKLGAEREWIMGLDSSNTNAGDPEEQPQEGTEQPQEGTEQLQQPQQGAEQPQQDTEQPQQPQQGAEQPQQPQQGAEQGAKELDYDDLVSLQQGDIQSIIDKYGITDEQDIDALNNMCKSVQTGSLRQDKYGNLGFVNEIEAFELMTSGMAEQAKAFNKFNKAFVGEHQMSLIAKGMEAEQNTADALLREQSIAKDIQGMQKKTTEHMNENFKPSNADSNFKTIGNISQASGNLDTKTGTYTGGKSLETPKTSFTINNGGSKDKDPYASINEANWASAFEQDEHLMKISGGKVPQNAQDLADFADLYEETTGKSFWDYMSPFKNTDGTNMTWGQAGRGNVDKDTLDYLNRGSAIEMDGDLEMLMKNPKNTDAFSRLTGWLATSANMPELARKDSAMYKVLQGLSAEQFKVLKDKGFMSKDAQRMLLNAAKTSGDAIQILESLSRFAANEAGKYRARVVDSKKSDIGAIARSIQGTRQTSKDLANMSKVYKDGYKLHNYEGPVIVLEKGGKLYELLKNGKIAPRE